MNQMATPVSHHEALIYAMVTLSAADRAMTDRELKKIGEIVRTVPIFADFDPEKLVATAEACGTILRGPNGLDTVLAILTASLPPRLHETCYALVVEVAAVDLHVEQEELRFLQILSDEFELDQLVVAAIERSARVRYRVKG